tara:strand:+ start:2380 stop:2637 length:258 start_codon:yes stop_codon:yes gene_type:complete
MTAPLRTSLKTIAETGSFSLMMQSKQSTKLNFHFKNNRLKNQSLPLYYQQDIFIFYFQWLILLLIGNTMKNTMLRNFFKKFHFFD